MSKANEALDRMAKNARELGLDYEPDGMHHNKPQKRPQNCGTGYCSCIECVMEPAQQKSMHPEIKKMYEDYFDKCFKESSAAVPENFMDALKFDVAVREWVPDALTASDGESAEYMAGWNDCRQAMLSAKLAGT